MRIVDERGNDAQVEDGAFVLEEARTWRVTFSDGATVRACSLGPVPLARGDDGAFVLTVGHAVGAAELTVETEETTHRQRIELRPRAQKLDVESWCALVDDLNAWLPGIILGLSEASQGSVAREGTPAGLLAAAVAPLVPALVRSVEAVVRAPRTVEYARDEQRRMHTVRRASADTLRWLGRHPSVMVFARSEASAVATSDPWVSARVIDVSLDHPANRAVRWYAGQVARHLRPIAAALRRAGSGRFDTTKIWCEAKARVLDEAANSLDRAVTRSFLSQIPAEPPGPSALLALADDPVYARVLRLARRILGARFSPHAQDDALPAPVRASFDLYELWCLLALRRALDAVLGEDAWTHPKHRRDDLFGHELHGLTLRRAAPGGEIEIGYNLTFHSHLVAPENDRVALTGERRPDLVVLWRPTEGAPTWVVLDAKYRVSKQALNESFAALHVYRDGLWWRSRGGRPRAGLLFVPEVSAECAPWATPAFRDTFGLGLWKLRPGSTPDAELGGWLLGVLRGQ